MWNEDGADIQIALFLSTILMANDFNRLIISLWTFLRVCIERSDLQMLEGKHQLPMLFFFSGNHWNWFPVKNNVSWRSHGKWGICVIAWQLQSGEQQLLCVLFRLAIPPVAAEIPQWPSEGQPLLNQITDPLSCFWYLLISDTSRMKSKSFMQNWGKLISISRAMGCLPWAVYLRCSLLLEFAALPQGLSV